MCPMFRVAHKQGKIIILILTPPPFQLSLSSSPTMTQIKGDTGSALQLLIINTGPIPAATHKALLH